MRTFHEMGLDPVIMKSLDHLKFNTPTPIQAETIPLAISGADIIGSAQTGTGKTLAFSIPLVQKLLANPKKAALVLTPTRELAQQVVNNVRDLLGYGSPLKTALIIGGEAMGKQLQQLKANPRIIVGTPGRVIDHMSRKTMQFRNIEFLVLDEMDRMFDMGFGIQLEEIIRQLPKERQTLMFSATLAPQIEKIAQKYLIEPKRISVGSTIKPGEGIKQDVLYVNEGDKYATLLKELNEREGSVIIFVKTKRGVEKLADKLCDEDYRAAAIHGDLRQHKRERVLNGFRQGRQRIMVATDVAARGIDIAHIQHVINYDPPQAPEDYIHRIGRTGRAGAQGSALSLITPQDRRKWNAIDALMNPDRAKSGAAKERNAPADFFDKKQGSGAKKSFGRKPGGDRKFASDRKFGSDNKMGGERKPWFSKSAEGESRLESGERKAIKGRKFGSDNKMGGERKPWFDKTSEGGFRAEGRERRSESSRNPSMDSKMGLDRGPSLGRKANFEGKPSFGKKTGFDGKASFEKKASFEGKSGFGRKSSAKPASKNGMGDKPLNRNKPAKKPSRWA